MKIFISIDMEGCSSVTDFAQVTPGTPHYADGKMAMQRDLQAAIEGARSFGSMEFLVCDAHGNGLNLGSLPSFGISGVNVVRGHSSHHSMMSGLDPSFDGAFFIGYHARRGIMSVMSHTYFPECVYAVKADDKTIGEFGINAMLCEYYGVAPLMVSGDEAFCDEAQDFRKDIATARVKKSLSANCALCYHDYADRIKSAVVQSLKRGKVVPPKPTCPLEVTFFTAAQADAAALMPDAVRVSGDSVVFTCGDYRKNFKAMLAGMKLAAAIPIC